MSLRLAETAAMAAVFTVFLGTSATADRSSAKITGVYKQLTHSEETGDLLGMAVDIREVGRPNITVTTCEGSCSGGKTWPLSISGQTITFTVCDDVFDQNGATAPCQPIKYVGRILSSGRLILQVEGAPETKIVLRHYAHPKPDEVAKLALAAG